MKIINILFSDKNGGIEQAFINYCRLLKTDNHQVLAIIKKDALYINDLKQYEIDFIQIDNKLGYYDFLAVQKIQKIISNFNADLIFAHVGRAIILTKKALKKFSKIPLIAVNHSNNVKRSIGANIILSVNKEIFYKTIDLGQNSSRSFVMPNMIEFNNNDMKNADIADFNFDAESLLTLGSMGRLSKEKGFEYLIKSVKILKDQGYKIKLKIAGSGEEVTNLKNLVSHLQLSKEVEFLGWIKDDQKKSFFSDIDIFCLSSLEETFGMVLLEAIKYQKPLIISNCDGPKTIIKNNINGILVEKSPIKNLPQNFSKSIIKLINNPDLVFDLVTNAQNNLLKNYSMKAIKGRMAEIIKIAFETLY